MNMTVNIELEPEQVDAIVIKELKDHYASLDTDTNHLMMLDAKGELPDHKREDLMNNARHMESIMGVLEFYLSDRDFVLWLDSYDGLDEDEDEDEGDTPVISVVDTIEHEDGSATFRIDIKADAVAAFAERGLRAVLIEAAEKCCQDSKNIAKEGE